MSVRWVCWLGVVLVGGYAARTPVRLQFVDASSGRPLDGVTVEAVEHGYHFNNRVLGFRNRLEPRAAGGDGTITLDVGFSKGRSYEFTTRRAGYRVTSVKYAGPPTEDAWLIMYLDKDAFVEPWVWSGYTDLIIDPGVVSKIAMYRVGEAVPVSALPKWPGTRRTTLPSDPRLIEEIERASTPLAH